MVPGRRGDWTFFVLGCLGVLVLSSLLFQEGVALGLYFAERAAVALKEVTREEGSAEVAEETRVPPAELAPEQFEWVRRDPSGSVAKNSTGRASTKRIVAVPVAAATVLAWAERGTIPEVRPRPAEDGLPAGLEVPSGGQFIAELRPGDRLVRMDGESVASLAKVMNLVVRARMARRKYIVGEFRRRTAEGVIRFDVAVEQPYPLEAPESEPEPKTSDP